MRGRCRRRRRRLDRKSRRSRGRQQSPDLDTMFATIKREFGHLDGVFVNAGYSEFLLSKR